MLQKDLDFNEICKINNVLKDAIMQWIKQIVSQYWTKIQTCISCDVEWIFSAYRLIFLHKNNNLLFKIKEKNYNYLL